MGSCGIPETYRLSLLWDSEQRSWRHYLKPFALKTDQICCWCCFGLYFTYYPWFCLGYKTKRTKNPNHNLKSQLFFPSLFSQCFQNQTLMSSFRKTPCHWSELSSWTSSVGMMVRSQWKQEHQGETRAVQACTATESWSHFPSVCMELQNWKPQRNCRCLRALYHWRGLAAWDIWL